MSSNQHYQFNKLTRFDFSHFRGSFWTITILLRQMRPGPLRGKGLLRLKIGKYPISQVVADAFEVFRENKGDRIAMSLWSCRWGVLHHSALPVPLSYQWSSMQRKHMKQTLVCISTALGDREQNEAIVPSRRSPLSRCLLQLRLSKWVVSVGLICINSSSLTSVPKAHFLFLLTVSLIVLLTRLNLVTHSNVNLDWTGLTSGLCLSPELSTPSLKFAACFNQTSCQGVETSFPWDHGPPSSVDIQQRYEHIYLLESGVAPQMKHSYLNHNWHNILGEGLVHTQGAWTTRTLKTWIDMMMPPRSYHYCILMSIV